MRIIFFLGILILHFPLLAFSNHCSMSFLNLKLEDFVETILVPQDILVSQEKIKMMEPEVLIFILQPWFDKRMSEFHYLEGLTPEIPIKTFEDLLAEISNNSDLFSNVIRNLVSPYYAIGENLFSERFLTFKYKLLKNYLIYCALRTLQLKLYPHLESVSIQDFTH